MMVVAQSLTITISDSVAFLGGKCCCEFKSLSSGPCQTRPRSSCIEKDVFFGTGLVEIILPLSRDLLGEGCFYECKSLSSVTLESGSKLSRIETGQSV
jgi:hypothetical protein